MKNITSMPIKRGEFVAREAGSGLFVSPNPVDLVVTPPPGQRVRLTHLSTASGGGEGDVTVAFGATNVLTSAVILGRLPTNDAYSVGNYQPYPAGNPPWGNHKYITGKTDEVLTVTKPFAISNTLYYAYEFGE